MKQTKAMQLFTVMNDAIWQMLDDLIRQFCEIQNDISEQNIRRYQAILKAQDMTFEEKSDFFYNEINHLINKFEADFKSGKINKDDRDNKIKDLDIFKEQLNKVVNKKFEYIEGIKELQDIVKASSFRNIDKRVFLNMLQRSIDGFTDPMITTGIKPEVFVKIKSLAASHGIDSSAISYGKATNGTYFACYTSDYANEFKTLLQEVGYNLGTLSRPAPEHVMLFAQNTYEPKDANITRISGLSPEMAEKMSEIGAYKTNIPFAKEDGDKSIIARTGESPVADERFLRTCKMLLESSFELSGEKGKKEARNVHIRAKEEDKINDAIRKAADKELSGQHYIYCIRAHHDLDENGNEIHSANTDVPYIDECVAFDNERLVRTNHGVQFDSVFANLEGTGYSYTLSIAAHAGDPEVERRLITHEEYMKFNDFAKGLFEDNSSEIKDPVKTKKYKSFLDLSLSELRNRFADLQEDIQDFKDHSQETEDKREEANFIEAYMAAIEHGERDEYATSFNKLDKEGKITALTNSLIACNIYKTQTKGYTFTNAIRAEKALSVYASQKLDSIKDSLSTGSVSYTAEIIKNFVRDLSYEDFIDYEKGLVSEGKLTEKMLNFEKDYFSDGKFEELKSNVLSNMNEVSFEIENVDRDPMLEKSPNLELFNRRADKSYLRLEEMLNSKIYEENIISNIRTPERAERVTDRDDLTR